MFVKSGPSFAWTHCLADILSQKGALNNPQRFEQLRGAKMPIVAIDGSSATGKTTIAKEVARRLRGHTLDTGEILRSATLAALELGLDPALPASIVNQLSTVRPDDDDPAKLYTVEIEQAVPIAAGSPVIQEAMTSLLRSHVDSTKLYVITGRSIGVDVFPDAALKVYLVASAEVRAARKAAQLGINPSQASNIIKQRDHMDKGRRVNPLRRHPAATEIDTTDCHPAEAAKVIIDSYRVISMNLD
jgi:cytidylate kinase